MRAALATAAVLALVPASAAAAPVSFQSPSGNIGCYMDRNGVRCDIAEHTWPTPPKPAWCEVDYGFGLFVGKRRRATLLCAGDTTLHQGRVLAYGRSVRRGRFRCRSRTDGMRCVNRRNGHGFFLSRDRVSRF